MFSIIKMPNYDYLDEEYDIVLTKQKGNSKGKNVDSKRVNLSSTILRLNAK